MDNLIKKKIGDHFLYINPEVPDWFVLNSASEKVVHCSDDDPRSSFEKKTILSQIEAQPFEEYRGRDNSLRPETLEELWLHITDRCNISCRHCLFSCNPHSQQELSFDIIKGVVNETYDSGTRIYYLTGGEPMCHPDFQTMCQLILNYHDTKLIILTNALLIKKHIGFFQNLPQARVFLQISFEGDKDYHDRIRGDGTFERLTESLVLLQTTRIKTSLAMTVSGENCGMMERCIDFAYRYNVSTVHYLWLFQDGMAESEKTADTDDIFNYLVKADKKAETFGITIDNIKTIAFQVFSSPGLKYDLGNAGFSSLAIGPDTKVYPSPALIGNKNAWCGDLISGMDNEPHVGVNLDRIWRESPLLKRLRTTSVADNNRFASNPLKYITGGWDSDHSFSHTGDFAGPDPYSGLAEKIVYYLIEKQINEVEPSALPAVVLKKGDRVESCGDSYNGIAFTHSGCMLSFDELNGKVGTFYSNAADEPNNDIQNPVCYESDLIRHIPDSAQIRSYGCGSPVLDAGLEKGESLVDLGSGAGVECFIASGLVGEKGRVTGIDMLDKMLSISRKSAVEVADNLGYNNLSFKKGFLEKIPVEDSFADKVISNCVINLSKNKIKTFSEIVRILKPGGTAVISDVVAETPFPVSIHEDQTLVGECIGGALVQARFIGLLKNAGFFNIKILKRFIYREVEGYTFFSITVRAEKKSDSVKQIIYPGPFAGVVTDDGRYIVRGREEPLFLNDEKQSDEALFIIDRKGNVTNSTKENTCSCYTGGNDTPREGLADIKEIYTSGCLYCGDDIVYSEQQTEDECFFCKTIKPANARCKKGHFICDSCHSGTLPQMIERMCLASDETEMLPLLYKIRNHSLVPLNGPEHHFIIPGIITSVYRNLGGEISDTDIVSAIKRGQDIPGGTCGFWGACGASLGAGIAFSTILSSSPLTPEARKTVQQAVSRIAASVSSVESARCCRRESISVLIEAAEVSTIILPVPLNAGAPENCEQFRQNRECPGKICPYFPTSANVSPFMKLA